MLKYRLTVQKPTNQSNYLLSYCQTAPKNKYISCSQPATSSDTINVHIHVKHTASYGFFPIKTTAIF